MWYTAVKMGIMACLNRMRNKIASIAGAAICSPRFYWFRSPTAVSYTHLDWPDVSGALAKVEEETVELREAIRAEGVEACAEELGDLLFSVVNVARFLHVSAEQSLGEACEKFICRFQKVEELAGARGLDMKSAGIEELDKLWNEAKETKNSQD